MRGLAPARMRAVSVAGVVGVALSMLVWGAEPASAAVSGVSSTTTTEVQAGSTAGLAGLSVSVGSSELAEVNVSTSIGTLAVNTATGVSLSYGYSASGAELSFSGTGAQVSAALATVTLTTSASAKKSSATISITARAADAGTYVYSSETGHYYQYVAASGVSWSDARAAAKTAGYRGQQGYLATVHSAGVNNLITSKIPGATNVWLGGQAVPGTGAYGRVWVWADGPNPGEVFSRCTSGGTSVPCDFVDSSSFYYNWSSGEPNNYGSAGEAYLVTNWTTADGKWNDLPNSASGISGYVIEFGDYATGSSGWTGIYSDSSAVLLAGTPDAPPSVSATPGEGQATVTFGAPASNSASAIDAYRVTTNPGGTQTECSSPCTLTGLTPAQTYTFSVQAHNTYGWSAASSAASATPGVRPGTPSGVPALLMVDADPGALVTATGYPAPTYSVTAGALPSGVTLDVSSGALGGAATATGSFSFEVTATNTYGAAAATFTGDIESIPTIATSALGTLRWNTPYDAMLWASAVPTETWSVAGGSLPAGLTLESDGRLHGTPTTVASYSVDITATNTHGSDTVTYAGNVDPIPATAPVIGVVTPGDGSLTLQFTAPTSSGGSAVTSYEYTINGGGTWLPGPVGVTTSPITVTGLTNGTAYSVSLRAITAAGGGAASTAAAGTPRTVPDAPSAITAVPGEGQVTVSFSAPPFDGGREVDKYRVTSMPGGVQTECSSPCTLTGLTVGQEYTFTAQAHNEAGWSVASSVASATPGQRPGVPTGAPTLMIVGNAPSATVSATGYPAPTFAVTAGALPAGVTVHSSTGVLAGLPTSTGVYLFEVTATNRHGTASATFMGSVESIPTISTTSLGTLKWSVAYDATLAASAVPTATWGVTDGALPPGLTLEADGNVHGTPTTVGAYAVEITATNTHGSDVANYSGTVEAIPATAPVITAVTPDDASLTLEFAAPSSTGGAVVTGYQYSLDGGTSWLAAPFGVTSGPLSITGLVNGTTYPVALRPVTVAGPGAASAPMDGTPRTVASAPTIDSVTASDHGLVVTFTPPSDDGGDAIMGYRYSLDGGATWNANVVATTTSPLSIFGLENGMGYDIALAAVNDAGDGAPSSVVSGVPVAAPVPLPGGALPEPPRGTGVGVKDGERVPATSELTSTGWKVTTDDVMISLQAYDMNARLVAGSGGEAYFQGYRGGYVLVRGDGFKPGSTAEVWIFSTPLKLGSLTVDSDGSFRGMLSLPTSLTVGAHTVQVNGVTASSESASTSVGIRMGNAPQGLASTGASVGWALAVQLTCAGLALVIVGRRRLAI